MTDVPLHKLIAGSAFVAGVVVSAGQFDELIQAGKHRSDGSFERDWAKTARKAASCIGIGLMSWVSLVAMDNSGVGRPLRF